VVTRAGCQARSSEIDPGGETFLSDERTFDMLFVCLLAHAFAASLIKSFAIPGKNKNSFVIFPCAMGFFHLRYFTGRAVSINQSHWHIEFKHGFSTQNRGHYFYF